MAKSRPGPVRRAGHALKNLLLWPSKNPVRKILDAVLAEQLVHAISKQHF